MPVLKSLSFTALPKSGNDPVQARRAKFVSKLEEQKLLLKDPNHVRTVQRWTKVNGERQGTTKQQAVPGGRRTQPARSLCPSGSGPGPSSSRSCSARLPRPARSGRRGKPLDHRSSWQPFFARLDHPTDGRRWAVPRPKGISTRDANTTQVSPATGAVPLRQQPDTQGRGTTTSVNSADRLYVLEFSQSL